jgi:hypothetical protein
LIQPASSGGLPLEAFDAIDDFVDQIRSGKVDKTDRYLHGSHPLALLVESALEVISTNELSAPIVGFSRTAEDHLVRERRKLERLGARDLLQEFLFAVERLCQLIRESGYGSRDHESALRFFVELFADWLERLGAWAGEETRTDLEARIAEALDGYLAVADDVVVIDGAG